MKDGETLEVDRAGYDVAYSHVRDSAIFYLKLDFALLAGFVTLATFLEINAAEAKNFLAHNGAVVWLLSSLILIGVTIEYFSQDARIALADRETPARIRGSLNLLRVLHFATSIGHAGLLALIVGLAVGSIDEPDAAQPGGNIERKDS